MDDDEIYWYILHMVCVISYIISVLVSLGVGIVVGLCLKGSHEFAARSLQKQLQISEGKNPITENSTAYYTVRIIVGKGNLYCRLLRRLGIPVRLVVSAGIRWIPASNPNSTGFHAHVYTLGVERRIFADMPNFHIIPNSEVELAVLKAEGNYKYALGGFMPDIPLGEDYNVSLRLINQDNQSLPKLTISNFLEKVGLV